MRIPLAVLLAACLCLPAFAGEEGAPRVAWPVLAPAPAGAAAKSLPELGYAPPAREREPLARLKPGASCGASELEVCFDASGRLTVPGARRFLPALPGLKPERLTVKRTGVVFAYSF